MTKEEKDLLLADLCARLPYDVKVQYQVGDIWPDIKIFNTRQYNELIIGHYTDEWLKCTFKPYLFPLSSMTEEQYEKFKNICGWDSDIEDVRRGKFSCIGYIGLDYFYDTIDWFNKNHFDYRGLIPMGLAIDATNLNIY